MTASAWRASARVCHSSQQLSCYGLNCAWRARTLNIASRYPSCFGTAWVTRAAIHLVSEVSSRRCRLTTVRLICSSAAVSRRMHLRHAHQAQSTALCHAETMSQVLSGHK